MAELCTRRKRKRGLFMCLLALQLQPAAEVDWFRWPGVKCSSASTPAVCVLSLCAADRPVLFRSKLSATGAEHLHSGFFVPGPLVLWPGLLACLYVFEALLPSCSSLAQLVAAFLQPGHHRCRD